MIISLPFHNIVDCGLSSKFDRIAPLVPWLVPSRFLEAPQLTSFQGRLPLERSIIFWCSGLSKKLSAGAWTERNSSDDPWKESLPKQGGDEAMWPFFEYDASQVLGNMDFSVPPPGFDPTLPPPTGTTFANSEAWRCYNLYVLLLGGPPPDLSGPPPSGEFPPSGRNNFSKEPKLIFFKDPFGEYSEVDPYSGGYEPTASAQVRLQLHTKSSK